MGKPSEREKKMLVNRYSILLGIKFFEIPDTHMLYELLRKKLTNVLDCKNDFTSKLANYNIPNSDYVFIIHSLPNKIYKIKYKDLIEMWDDIWNPPEDDALIIDIPRLGKTILLTHYNVYYTN